MGAWEFVRDRLGDIVNGRQSLVRVARAASGSPATGSHTLHDLEQADILAASPDAGQLNCPPARRPPPRAISGPPAGPELGMQQPGAPKWHNVG